MMIQLYFSNSYMDNHTIDYVVYYSANELAYSNTDGIIMANYSLQESPTQTSLENKTFQAAKELGAELNRCYPWSNSLPGYMRLRVYCNSYGVCLDYWQSL